jgi:hypothetical protein
MRKLINLLLSEAPVDLKKQVINLVQQTSDQDLLNKVLVALKSTDLSSKLKKVLSTDKDANKMVDRLAKLIINVDGTVAEKEKFADDFKSGFVDSGKLLDGKQHTFDEIITPGFPQRVFALLATELTSQGVGPGEVALAVMSPNISHSGRASGGGDLQIDGKAVEVKTTVSKGGRWSDARKGELNMQGIKKELTTALEGSGIDLPPRLGIGFWLTQVRPWLQENGKDIKKITQVMADGLFSKTNNSQYQKALAEGDAQAILDAILQVGYDNYKAYSKFDGMLMIDIRGGGTAQYFGTYEDMQGKIKPSTAYLYAPESEAMPQVELIATVGGRAKALTPGKTAADKAEIDQKISDINKPTRGIRPKRAEPAAAKTSSVRKKR